MNAPVWGRPKLALVHSESPRLSPEALDLLTRALLLTVPLEHARQSLGEPEHSTRRNSQVYRALAQQEVWRVQHLRRWTADGEGLVPTLDQLGEIFRKPGEATPDKIAGLLFRLLAGCQLSDPVLFRRLGEEVDALIYQIAVQCR